jgi:hypothetical protein
MQYHIYWCICEGKKIYDVFHELYYSVILFKNDSKGKSKELVASEFHMANHGNI